MKPVGWLYKFNTGGPPLTALRKILNNDRVSQLKMWGQVNCRAVAHHSLGQAPTSTQNKESLPCHGPRRRKAMKKKLRFLPSTLSLTPFFLVKRRTLQKFSADQASYHIGNFALVD
ncbi:hypothetical protein SAY87_003962 [Trapa incisa]|uniref:Uncharacterized protein n=1 Tax=Trapa incisa TaxID=236973 RepID=A0AAN7JN73_9MYRT|nr:hypothetical protein SAY87_003962 [Trapa incisa]